MLNHIVVAIDGSVSAERAFDFACDLAGRFKATLHIVHVAGADIPAELRHMAEVEHLVPSPAFSERAGTHLTSGLTAALQRNDPRPASSEVVERIGEHLLQSVARDAREAGLGQVETRMLHGDPAAAILGYLEQVAADAVVVGTRGLGTLRQLTLGSVSHKLSQHAACPCITVR
jgi:nucleotide-binding universal stress UspA family protein